MLYVKKNITQREIDQHSEWVRKHNEQSAAALKKLGITDRTKKQIEEKYWQDLGKSELKTEKVSRYVIGVGSKKPIYKYTGTEMLGTATLHKSNEIPVFRNEDILDIAKMRR